MSQAGVMDDLARTKELKVNECNGDITPPTRNLPIHARLPLMAGVRKPRKNRLVTAAASVVLVIVLFSGWWATAANYGYSSLAGVYVLDGNGNDVFSICAPIAASPKS
jgi:hypothetical protein